MKIDFTMSKRFRNNFRMLEVYGTLGSSNVFKNIKIPEVFSVEGTLAAKLITILTIHCTTSSALSQDAKNT